MHRRTTFGPGPNRNQSPIINTFSGLLNRFAGRNPGLPYSVGATVKVLKGRIITGRRTGDKYMCGLSLGAFYVWKYWWGHKHKAKETNAIRTGTFRVAIIAGGAECA
jgi:hypothetical protein